MRKLISIDRVKMKQHGYQGAPIRQICMLNLSAEEQMMLLNLFSHKSDWTIGTKGMSERSFFREKHHKRTNKMISKLKDMGYVSETDTTYIMNLDKIQEDYKKNKDIEKVKTLKNKPLKNPNGGTESTPLQVTEIPPYRGLRVPPIILKNNGQGSAPAGSAHPALINKTKGIESVVGDMVAPSAATPSGSLIRTIPQLCWN